MIDFLIAYCIMNSMCSIDYCLNAIILTIDLDYGAMTALSANTDRRNFIHRITFKDMY